MYTTLAPPQHTVVPRGGVAAESLAGVEYLVFTELVWAGKATMTHTCLVEHAWLEQLLPLVEQAGRLPALCILPYTGRAVPALCVHLAHAMHAPCKCHGGAMHMPCI